MRLRKNAFFFAALTVFLFSVLFALSCALSHLGAGQRWPELAKGRWLMGTCGGMLALLVMGAAGEKWHLRQRLERHPLLCRRAEGLTAAGLVLVGVLLRAWVIRTLPVEPQGDCKTFYDLAALLQQGKLLQEGAALCDAVALFPRLYGYPRLLSRVFALFGTSVSTALWFNLWAQAASWLLLWRIGRRMAGRLCGVLAMGFAALLPSGILYSNQVSGEPVLTLFLLLAVWLFTLSLQPGVRAAAHPWLCSAQLSGMGLALAFSVSIRPAAVVLLAAALLCLPGGRTAPPVLPRNEIPLGTRAADRGWKRCVILLLSFLLASALLRMSTAYAVDRDIAGSTSFFGYDLMVGLNQQSGGGWNQSDADFLSAALETTGSPSAAQLACRARALERLLNTEPGALGNLFVQKFDALWGHDAFAAQETRQLLAAQSNLTAQQQRFLDRMTDLSSGFYLTLLLLSGIWGVLMLRRPADTSFLCVLMFCGTAGVCLLSRTQDGLHYHILPLLAMFSGAAVSGLLQRVGDAVTVRNVHRGAEAAQAQQASQQVRRREAEAEGLARLRTQALQTRFDLEKAVREGHIRIIASEGVLNGETASAPPAEAHHDPQT